MNNDTNISNYLGSYTLGVAYEKFDFVFNESDGIYYYAKNDVSAENSINPTEDSGNWSSDHFFFDADYGSSVSFACNNFKHEYADGYYIYQPKGINSLKIEINLQFKNRTNKEASAIIHFIESHLGQYEKDRPSFNLKYTQGLKGFYWDSLSSFYPYASTSINSKKFHCLSYSHSLNFENSNDVSVKITNFDTSLLNKSEALFIDADSVYDENVYYEKNDVVFYEGNHQYYYCTSDQPIVSKEPVVSRSIWNRNGGFFEDKNKDVWTRDFDWRPSLSMKTNISPRLKAVNLSNNYTQLYRDGINEKLLNLDLEFNNRSDSECRAILHFLEQHYGCRPFRLKLPAPYEKTRNFVCQEWSHVYNYKDNHSIKIKIEEYPFALSSEAYDGLVTQAELKGSEFIISSNILIEDPFLDIGFNDFFRQRVFFKNTGDADLTINSMYINGGNFRMVGQELGVFGDSMCVVDRSIDNDYIVQLPEDESLPFDLSGSIVQIFKRYTTGMSGGITFCKVTQNENGKYVREVQNGRANSFFQNNLGSIMNLSTSEISRTYRNYIDAQFFNQNKTNTLPAAKTGYIDLYYTAEISQDDFNDFIEFLDFLTFTQQYKVFGGELEINITNSEGEAEQIVSSVMVDLKA